jgi:hypothetical protein
MNTVLSGNAFKKQYGTKFYKILKRKCIHNGYEFIDGLNIDPIPFNTTIICSRGWILFY